MVRTRILLCCVVLVLCLGAPVVRGQTLWGYYPIHENDFQDYSGNDHHGTPVDGPVTQLDPVRGWVAAFNAEPEKPSRIECGTSDPSAGGELTVSAWLNWQGTNGNWQGIAGKSFSFEDRRWIFQLRDSDGVIQWGGADQASLHLWSNVAPAVDEWLHVVGTCDGTTSRIYIDGEIVGEGPGGFAPGAAGANVTLGFGEDRNDYDESFNGALDEIHILTRALSQAQVQDLASGVLPSFDKAREPNPADGAMGVFMPLLQWTAGDGAVFHDIYLGTTAELGPDQLVAPRNPLKMYYHPVPLEPGTTYYWCVNEIELDGVTIHPGDVWSFTTQDVIAYHPSPADGAVDASPVPTLTWQPGLGAIQHHVYFSDSFEDVNTAAPDADKGLLALADASFAPGELESLTTYSWRVDEILGGDVVRAGDVWRFTTFLPVEDFEGYTDEVGERIFQTWLDGLGYTEPQVVEGNGTGATVGYVEPPFAEQKIVHGGMQSMPMDYNNAIAPYYSEAERTWATAQDWTVNDANALVLHVRGKSSNDPGTLYVAVRDNAGRIGVVSYADPAVVTATKWIAWRIALSEFTAAGVNVATVRKMYIGVGDRDAPIPGGAGSLYIDDIYVIKPVSAAQGL